MRDIKKGSLQPFVWKLNGTFKNSETCQLQYDRVHELRARYGLTETWLVSGEAGSDDALNYTRRLLGKSR